MGLRSCLMIKQCDTVLVEIESGECGPGGDGFRCQQEGTQRMSILVRLGYKELRDLRGAHVGERREES